MNIAKQKGIKLEVKVRLNKELIIDDSLVAVMLGNALENAIEAVSKDGVEKKEVSLIINTEKRILYIRVRNDFVGELEILLFNAVEYIPEEDDEFW